LNPTVAYSPFWPNPAELKHNNSQVAKVKRDPYEGGLFGNLYRTWPIWIWFVGAAAWFLAAALSLHRHSLGSGLVATVISALFLAAGMFFRRQAKRSGKR
jgi:hypothetical protein